MYYLIYKITNKINNKIYIGMHKTKNINDNYMGSGTEIKKDINKFGKKNFIKEILFELRGEQEMIQKEMEIVDINFINRKDTYNQIIGGTSGFYKINERGLNNNANQCYRCRYLLETDPLFKETFRNKVSSALLEYYKTHDGKFTNKKHTKESKEKIAAANSMHQIGEKNSQFGTCWITKNNKSIKIQKSEIQNYINDGWVKGRQIKYKSK